MRRLQHAVALVLIAAANCLMAAPNGWAADKKDTLTFVTEMKTDSIDAYFSPQKEAIYMTPNIELKRNALADFSISQRNDVS